MAMLDSVDKVITRYFVAVTKEQFIYKGKTYIPKPLKVSSLLLRDYTCPPDCGACCPRFSLDYLPDDIFPYPLQPREINFNDKTVIIYSDTQQDHSDYHCRNLTKENGRCGIHKKRPFSCDFELIRPLLTNDPNGENVLTQKLFGRKWAMKKIDGTRGTMCEMTPITDHSIDEVIRKLNNLDRWCFHFSVSNKCQEIIHWIGEIRPYISHREIKSKTF
jgi:hypothetical protein